MTKEEKQQIIYLAMKAIYKEFNYSINNLIILREFLNDIYNFSEGTEKLNFDYPSIQKELNKE